LWMVWNPRQVREQVRREPLEALRLANLAQWDFQVVDPPRRLDGPPRQREPKAEPPRVLAEPQGARPELINDGIGDRATEDRPEPVRERGEEPLVGHAQVLVRKLARPAVERNPLDPERVSIDVGRLRLG